jgi:hypothetical protein
MAENTARNFAQRATAYTANTFEKIQNNGPGSD